MARPTVAQAYLEYLYSKEGQDIIARNHYRPRDAAVAAQYASTFGKTGTLVTIADFGGWAKAQATHFDDGGTFDHSFAPVSSLSLRTLRGTVHARDRLARTGSAAIQSHRPAAQPPLGLFDQPSIFQNELARLISRWIGRYQ